MHEYEFGDIRYLHKVKQYLGQGLSAFWPDDLGVYMRQLPPHGGAWHHRWMAKVIVEYRVGENARQTNRNPAGHTTTGISWRHRDQPAYPTGTCKQELPLFWCEATEGSETPSPQTLW